MQIYLLDINKRITDFWEKCFLDVPEVTVVQDDFRHFMKTHDVECVVSPANSYGLMDGGYDLAITEWFGTQLMQSVQGYILKHYCGEQPVGTSFIIDTPVAGKKLIHTPSMRVPSRIRDNLVVYQCMRTTLIAALENNIQSIVIPAFGGLCGGVPAPILCTLMREAYDQVMNPPKKLDWNSAVCNRKLEERYR